MAPDAHPGAGRRALPSGHVLDGEDLNAICGWLLLGPSRPIRFEETYLIIGAAAAKARCRPPIVASPAASSSKASVLRVAQARCCRLWRSGRSLRLGADAGTRWHRSCC